MTTQRRDGTQDRIAEAAGIDAAAFRKAHAFRWRTNGYGYDVTCACGWDSRIGYGTRGAVDREKYEHLISAAVDAKNAAAVTA